MTADPLVRLEEALGAEILRAQMLGGDPPRIAGRYVLRRFLGRGARGLVLEAEDARLGRVVALKVSLASGAADREILDEARALARLEHPNVVRVHDVDSATIELDGVPTPIRFVSMQRVDGVTLRSWLRSDERSHPEIIDMFVRAGEGLAAAHDARIVHRDFKPDNVLVGIDGTPQVVDFGFAIHDYSSTVSEPATDVVGTDPYLAPEARRGRATPRSDQYAFAISLVEALTGDPTPPEQEPRAHVDPVLWTVLLRATDRDPRVRYPDVRALLRELRGAKRWTVARGLGLLLAVVVGVVVMLNAGANACSRLDSTNACAHAAGDWSVTSSITQGAAGLPPGTTGVYALELEPLGDCRFRVWLRRTSDTLPGRPTHKVAGRGATPALPIEVQAEERDGVVFARVRARFRNPWGAPSDYTHDFRFELRDRLVGGSFSATSQRDEYRGVLFGFRTGT